MNILGHKSLRAVWVAVLVVMSLLIGHAPAANAAPIGNFKSYWDGKYPNQWYDGHAPCNWNASQIDSFTLDRWPDGARTGITVRVYYSWSCGTNWVRVDNNPYGGKAHKFMNGGLGNWLNEDDFGTAASYSAMLYAPGNTSLTAGVYLYDTAGNMRALGYENY